MFDVLTFDPTASNPMAAMAHYQQEDLIALGKIILGKQKFQFHTFLINPFIINTLIINIFDRIFSIGLQ